MPVACEVWTRPYLTAPWARLPDRAADYYAGTATVLADLEVTWGRGTVVDQPDPASAKFVVIDPAGGSTFLQQTLEVGNDVNIWAAGDIGVGDTLDVCRDGQLETLPLGVEPGWSSASPCRNLSNEQHAGTPEVLGVTTEVVTGQSPTGQCLSVFLDDQTTLTGDRRWAMIGPWVGGKNQPATSWDTIASIAAGSQWTSRLKIRAGVGAKVTRYLVAIQSPQAYSFSYVGAGATHTGDQTWRQSSITRTITDPTMVGRWVGTVVYAIMQDWATMPAGSWESNTWRWTDYTGLWLDDAEMLTVGSSTRRALVFSGKITDLAAHIRDDGAVELEVTSVDQMGQLANTFVGDVPWPMETLAARVERLRQMVTGWSIVTIADAFKNLQISRRDVDRQPLADLYSGLAVSVDAVLWSATHATSGQYLWFEDPARRESAASLTFDGSYVQIAGNLYSAAVLDACWINRDVSWVRDVSDVITRVDATWLDQAPDPENPSSTDVTERWIPTQVDATAESKHGQRHIGISTQLVNATDCTTVATRTLTRTRQLQWRAEDMQFDVWRLEDDAFTAVNAAMNLLDGTTRLGAALVVQGIADWPIAKSLGAFLDGGEYRYDEKGWTLNLKTTPYAGFGKSATWAQLQASATAAPWRWNQYAPSIGWDDMYGVAAPT